MCLTPIRRGGDELWENADQNIGQGEGQLQGWFPFPVISAMERLTLAFGNYLSQLHYFKMLEVKQPGGLNAEQAAIHRNIQDWYLYCRAEILRDHFHNDEAAFEDWRVAQDLEAKADGEFQFSLEFPSLQRQLATEPAGPGQETTGAVQCKFCNGLGWIGPGLLNSSGS